MPLGFVPCVHRSRVSLGVQKKFHEVAFLSSPVSSLILSGSLGLPFSVWPDRSLPQLSCLGPRTGREREEFWWMAPAPGCCWY